MRKRPESVRTPPPVAEPRPAPPAEAARRAALRIAVGYLVFGLVWIWISDRLLYRFGVGGEPGFYAGAIKGTAFVLLSGLLVFGLARSGLRRAARANDLVRAVAEGTADSIFVKDVYGKYLLVNTAAAGFVEKSVADVLGRIDTELYDTPSAVAAMERDRAVMSRGVSETREEELTAGGVTRTFLTTKSPYRDADGNVIGVIGISRDVTEWKRAHEAVRASEKSFRDLADAIPQIVWTAGPDGGLTHLNARAAEYSGLPVDALMGDGWSRLVHPDDSARSAAAWAETLRSGIPQEQEFRIRRADGEYRWHITRQVSVRDAAGTIVRWYGASTDVEDLKRADAALRDERTLLRAIIDTIPDHVFTKDAAGRYALCNRALLESVGAAAERDLAGKTLADLYPPDRAAAYRAYDLSVLAGETVLDREELVPGPDGRETWRLITKRPLRDRTGTIVGLVGISRNIQHRKERERLLAESRRRLNLALAAAHMGVWEMNFDTGTVFWSPECTVIFGAAEPARTYAEFKAYLHPDDADRVEAASRAAVAGRVDYAVDYRIVRADGSVRWLADLAQCEYAADGRPVRQIGTVQDITDRKLAEAAVRESEDRYRRLVDVLPAAVFLHADRRIVFCNPAYVRLMGAAGADDLLGRDPYDFVAPEYGDLAAARTAAIRETGHAVPGVDSRIVRLDGRSVPVHSVATPLSYSGQTGILVALTDLTERERTADLLRSVLGSVSDPILTIDARGTIRSTNPATAQTFGYPEPELVGRNVGALMPEPFRSGAGGYLADNLRTGEAKLIGVTREVAGRRKDGSEFPIDLTVTEFELDGERHFTGVVRDITARKELEAQFRQAQKMESIGRLAGGVAHDFNNLLSVINGYSELVLMGMLAGDPNRESVAAIMEAGERAARLTQQLLAFSRKTILRTAVLDLNDLVAESAELLRRLIGEDVVLAVDADPAPCRIKADLGLIEQVVMNLAVNARDAMPAGGRLTLRVRAVEFGPDDRADLPPGRYARLTVADTGAGMSDDVKGKIFDPFFTTKGVGKGTGLGLSVVHGVVEQCGGHIGVESGLGAGTTFTLHFPLTAEAPKGAGSGGHPLPRRTETVLLVEDEPVVRTLARVALESAGYRVLEAGDGAAGLRVAAEFAGPIALLVTDVVMPEMGGRELADAVRAARPDIRILYMSGYADDAVLRHGAFDAGDAFLAKPFTPLGLARKVKDVLAGP